MSDLQYEIEVDFQGTMKPNQNVARQFNPIHVVRDMIQTTFCYEMIFLSLDAEITSSILFKDEDSYLHHHTPLRRFCIDYFALLVGLWD